MNDRWTIRIVAAILGAVTLVACVGAQLLAWADVAVPEDAKDMGNVAIGALAALLANTRSNP